MLKLRCFFRFLAVLGVGAGLCSLQGCLSVLQERSVSTVDAVIGQDRTFCVPVGSSPGDIANFGLNRFGRLGTVLNRPHPNCLNPLFPYRAVVSLYPGITLDQILFDKPDAAELSRVSIANQRLRANLRGAAWDEPPSMKRMPQPTRTAELERLGIYGLVTVRIGFSENGAFDKLVVVHSDHPKLSEELAKVLSRWSAVPPKRNGNALAFSIEQTFDFNKDTPKTNIYEPSFMPAL